MSDALLGPELMARVKAIRIRTNRLVSSALAGGYKSSFKGSGIEFEEVRAYQVGDDVRSIDWKVTARKGEPQVKTFREDRQLTLHLLVDTGRSMDFGTRRVTKRELAAEFCALLSFVALGTRDRVGLTLFGKQSGMHLASGRTSAHVNRLVREVIAAEPTLGQTNFVQMLEERVRDRSRHNLMFIVSDFQGLLGATEAEREKVKSLLLVLGARHDVVAVPLEDPFESELPKAGLIELDDPVTGESILVDTSSKRVRESWAQAAQARTKYLDSFLSKCRIGVIRQSTSGDITGPIVRFFEGRSRGVSKASFLGRSSR
ncbi:MAG: hypothetical protein ACJAVJ_000111 [Planctomycetota bacterium]|jgi:uncharacterized protein (DUF58 family)